MVTNEINENLSSLYIFTILLFEISLLSRGATYNFKNLLCCYESMLTSPLLCEKHVIYPLRYLGIIHFISLVRNLPG